jgi:hypothetical protein
MPPLRKIRETGKAAAHGLMKRVKKLKTNKNAQNNIPRTA